MTEAVRRHPYSIILFDEIEKAHPDVFNIFLQILDEGRLTDSQGRTVSFKNSIIIMTSNIGSDQILQAHTITDTLRRSIEEKLYKTFRPEFLNRIDAIVFFKMLSPDDVKKIARIQLNELVKRLEKQQITLTFDDAVIAVMAEHGYVPELGARPLKRAIQQFIIVPLSQYMLKNPEVKTIKVSVDSDKGIVIK